MLVECVGINLGTRSLSTSLNHLFTPPVLRCIHRRRWATDIHEPGREQRGNRRALPQRHNVKVGEGLKHHLITATEHGQVANDFLIGRVFA